MEDNVIEDTESFLVSIQQISPPLTIQSGTAEVFIEDSDGKFTQLCIYGRIMICFAPDVVVLPNSGDLVTEGDTHSLCVTIEYEGTLERPVQVFLIPNSG